MIRFAFTGLTALTATLAALVAIELGHGSDRDSGIAAIREPSPAVGGPSAAVHTRASDHTDEWVETILARPLFSPSRRPPAVSAGPAAETVIGMPRLAGILISPDGKRAIFARPGGGKPLTTTEGDKIDRWTVLSIEMWQVTLSGPDGSHVLHPSFENGTTPAPQPVRPAGLVPAANLAVTNPAILLRRGGQNGE